MTKLIYEKRLALYPRYITLTEPLRKGKMTESSADKGYFQSVLEALDEWNSGEAGFLVSLASLDRYYEMRNALRVKPAGPGEQFSKEQVDRIWEAKNSFRRSLRDDLRLVYGEETPPPHR